MVAAWARQRAGTTLFAAFNLAVLLVVHVAIVRPTYALLTAQAVRLDERAGELTRYQAFAEQENRARTLLGRAQDESAASIFLVGSDEGAGSAALQARLKEVNENAGLQIRSIAALEPFSQNGVRYLGAQIDVSGPIAAVYDAPRNLESGVAPALYVKALTIRALATVDDSIPLQEPELNAQIEVYGATGHAVPVR
jgi:hypothetical protein